MRSGPGIPTMELEWLVTGESNQGSLPRGQNVPVERESNQEAKKEQRNHFAVLESSDDQSNRGGQQLRAGVAARAVARGSQNSWGVSRLYRYPSRHRMLGMSKAT